MKELQLNILIEKGWENFTKEDWDYLRLIGVVNWYGPSGHPILNFILTKLAWVLSSASADIHDWNYFIGWGAEDKEKADYGFYKRMVEDIYSSASSRNLYYATLAYTYFLAVSLLGSRRYNYR